MHRNTAAAILREAASAYKECVVHVRGHYQEYVLRWDLWSGAELRGAARRWGGKYARSRHSLLLRIEGNKLGAVFEGPSGKYLLVCGERALKLLSELPMPNKIQVVQSSAVRAYGRLNGVRRRIVAILNTRDEGCAKLLTEEVDDFYVALRKFEVSLASTDLLKFVAATKEYNSEIHT